LDSLFPGSHVLILALFCPFFWVVFILAIVSYKKLNGNQKYPQIITIFIQLSDLIAILALQHF
jgi:hypothetical protein